MNIAETSAPGEIRIRLLGVTRQQIIEDGKRMDAIANPHTEKCLISSHPRRASVEYSKLFG